MDILDRKFVTEEQLKRNKDIDDVLKLYHEIDIPDEIIHKINRKFKSTKNYDFIRTEQIETGMIIRTVGLDMKKISTTGIVINILPTSTKKIGIILLYNQSSNIYWRINPDKFYIFKIEKYSKIRNEINLYMDKINLNN